MSGYFIIKQYSSQHVINSNNEPGSLIFHCTITISERMIILLVSGNQLASKTIETTSIGIKTELIVSLKKKNTLAKSGNLRCLILFFFGSRKHNFRNVSLKYLTAFLNLNVKHFSYQVEKRNIFSERGNALQPLNSDEEEDGYDSPHARRRGASVDEFLRGSELGRQVLCVHHLFLGRAWAQLPHTCRQEQKDWLHSRYF